MMQDTCSLYRITDACGTVGECQIPQVNAIRQVYNRITCEYEDCGDPEVVRFPCLKDQVNEDEDLDDAGCLQCFGIEEDNLIWAETSRDYGFTQEGSLISKDCPYTGDLTVVTSIFCSDDEIRFFFSILSFKNGMLCSVKDGPDIACACEAQICCGPCLIEVDTPDGTFQLIDQGIQPPDDRRWQLTVAPEDVGGGSCVDCASHPDADLAETYVHGYEFAVTCNIFEDMGTGATSENWTFSASANCFGTTIPPFGEFLVVDGGSIINGLPCGPKAFTEEIELEYGTLNGGGPSGCIVTFRIACGTE
jgi:hypothetical protein